MNTDFRGERYCPTCREVVTVDDEREEVNHRDPRGQHTYLVTDLTCGHRLIVDRGIPHPEPRVEPYRAAGVHVQHDPWAEVL